MTGILINQLKRLADTPVQSLATTDLVPTYLANGETRAVQVGELIGAGPKLIGKQSVNNPTAVFAAGGYTTIPGLANVVWTSTAQRTYRFDFAWAQHTPSVAIATNFILVANGNQIKGVTVPGGAATQPGGLLSAWIQLPAGTHTASVSLYANIACSITFGVNIGSDVQLAVQDIGP